MYAATSGTPANSRPGWMYHEASALLLKCLHLARVPHLWQPLLAPTAHHTGSGSAPPAVHPRARHPIIHISFPPLHRLFAVTLPVLLSAACRLCQALPAMPPGMPLSCRAPRSPCLPCLGAPHPLAPPYPDRRAHMFGVHARLTRPPARHPTDRVSHACLGSVTSAPSHGVCPDSLHLTCVGGCAVGCP